MDKRAQISFDFILTIVVALVFVGAMQVFVTQIQESQHSLSIRAQQRSALLELYSVASAANALSDADSMHIEFQTPKILAGEKQGKCSYIISNNKIAVSYEALGETFEEEISVKMPMSGTTEIPCGENLSISMD